MSLRRILAVDDRMAARRVAERDSTAIAGMGGEYWGSGSIALVIKSFAV
jgi:hypothetical protein